MDKQGFSIGSWSQGLLSARDQRLVTYLFGFQALFRGIDYYFDRSSDAPEFDVVFAAFGNEMWGMLFIVSALFLLLSALFRVHKGVWMGHLLLTILFFFLTLGFLLAAEVSVDSLSLRGPALAAISCVFNAMYLLRTGKTPMVFESYDTKEDA